MTEQEAAPHDSGSPRDVSEATESASGAASYSVMPRMRVEYCACGWFIAAVDLEPFIRAAVEKHNALPIHELWRARCT